MAQLQKLAKLSAPHCVLLAVHYASESNIGALRAVTALRDADLDLELILRIILTYLPEGAEPSTYLEYLAELASDDRTPGDDPATVLDLSPVENLSISQARKQRRKLELLQIAHTLYRFETELDPLTHFLIHRAHRIDAETGLLNIIPQLIVPFIGHSEYIRIWLISTALPLLRLTYEYYPQSAAPSLEEFARLKGRRAIDVQLSNLRQTQDGLDAARDIRGVVGPWMCGANERKRRRLTPDDRRASMTETPAQEPEDWECLFEWLVHTSKTNLTLVSSAIVEWDGPEDLDLGGFEEGRVYVDDETQGALERRYAQTALACLYLVDSSSTETLRTAHALLARVSDLLGLEPPPELSVAADSLPSCSLNMAVLHEATVSSLQEEHIARPDNPLTQPNQDAAHLLELFLFSACVLSNLQQSVSIKEVTRMFIRNDASAQLSLLQKIIHALSTSAKFDGEQWRVIRAKLLWLWNWGSTQPEGDRYARGLFGHIDSKTLETEILKGLLESSQYSLVVQLYVRPASGQQPLPLTEVEKIVLTVAIHHYDNASNGNRTRGGMKRVSDIVAAFNPHFSNSGRFQRIQALLSATHAMSFYSLILQHGVPFQPVNIRVSADPLSLIKKLLEQNLRSYTHLYDLISIGQNLVVAMPSTLMNEDADHTHLDAATIEEKKAAAERRVIGMTVEAALTEDDFETAYSYVVNRLTPHAPSPPVTLSISTSQHFSFGSYDSDAQEEEGEDVAWRAALEAGRHRSSPSASLSWTQTNTAARPDLRRLEQRMELLSQALLLTRPRHLEEVLAVWQECETEMTNLLAQETEAEERFNDAADRRLPGAFAIEPVVVQPRREVGRGAVEEAPMGLFDVARGAAAAFSKSAFPLRGTTRTASGAESRDTNSDAGRVSMDMSDSGSIHSGGEERVRRRDMVASAVTGGLASGLGWVLGATPVNERGRE